MEIKLVRPTKELKEKAEDFKQEFFDNGEAVINGSELLDKTDNYDEWLKSVTDNTSGETVNPNWVITDTFFALDEAERIIGIIDLRHTLNDFLKDMGNCGYSVRPSERRKGYATEMLRQILNTASKAGLSEIHLSVERDNEPSIKTIRKNGGVYERSFEFEGEQADVYRIVLYTIQKELNLAESKMIEEVTYNNYKLVKLTRNNVAIVEAMIRNDSAYIRSSDVTAKPVYNSKNNVKYGGSSAYWMTQLKRVLVDGKISKYLYKEIITGAVEAVDRENSTHLNADGCGRLEVIERICNFDKNELIMCLKDPNYEDMKLIREIARRTSAEKRARKNVSFASKFCHYACFYLFENTEYQDNYSIYDSILKTVLPWYLEYFKIDEKYDLEDYKQYSEAVDKVRQSSEIEISRNGFDHLLWYYHKGRI